MEDVTRLRNSLFFSDGKKRAAPLNDRHLLVRMIVRRSYCVGSETKAADHEILTNYHLSLDALFEMLNWDFGPIGM